MAGALVPGKTSWSSEVEPLPFNIFQLDTIEGILTRCAEAAMRTGEVGEYFAGSLVRTSFPPGLIGYPVLIPHPDDDDRIIETEVDLSVIPPYAAIAMAHVVSRYAEEVRFDEGAHAATKRAPQDAGEPRSEFLSLAPGPGVPILEHERLSEVVSELLTFLQGVFTSGFTVEM